MLQCHTEIVDIEVADQRQVNKIPAFDGQEVDSDWRIAVDFAVNGRCATGHQRPICFQLDEQHNRWVESCDVKVHSARNAVECICSSVGVVVVAFQDANGPSSPVSHDPSDFYRVSFPPPPAPVSPPSPFLPPLEPVPPDVPVESNDSTMWLTMLGAAVIGAAVLLCFVCIVSAFVWRCRRRRKNPYSGKPRDIELQIVSPGSADAL